MSSVVWNFENRARANNNYMLENYGFGQTVSYIEKNAYK